VATAEDAAEAARARDDIETQTKLVYAAALAWVAFHGEEEEPAKDSTLARASTTLSLMLLRSLKRMTRAPVPMPRGEDRTNWIDDTAQDVTRRAVKDARAHWSTVYKREKRKAADVSLRTVQTVFADEKAWSEAASRTEATQLAAEAAMTLHPDVETITGEPHSKMWISRGDSKVRKSHRHLHANVKAVGDDFKPGLRYPGDPSAPPEERYNCRCVLFLVPTVEADKANEVFKAEDFVGDADTETGLAASGVSKWDREQARRDWLVEQGFMNL
jgi:hypothetical protein